MTACAKCGYDAEAPVESVFAAFVQRDVRSMNEHRVNAGAARWDYKRERDAWTGHLRLVFDRVLREPVGQTLRRVTITREWGPRRRAFDRDNLVGGCKVVVDAMVRAGLLVGDEAVWAEIHYEQRRGMGAVSGTWIRIETLAQSVQGDAATPDSRGGEG